MSNFDPRVLAIAESVPAAEADVDRAIAGVAQLVSHAALARAELGIRFASSHKALHRGVRAQQALMTARLAVQGMHAELASAGSDTGFTPVGYGDIHEECNDMRTRGEDRPGLSVVA